MSNLDHLTFTEWLIELNACAHDAGYRGGVSLVATTGTMCWFSYYLEGVDPSAALDMAAQDGMEFGEDYTNI